MPSFHLVPGPQIVTSSTVQEVLHDMIIILNHYYRYCMHNQFWRKNVGLFTDVLAYQFFFPVQTDQ